MDSCTVHAVFCRYQGEYIEEECSWYWPAMPASLWHRMTGRYRERARVEGGQTGRWIAVMYTKFSVDIKDNVLKRSIVGTVPPCQLACDVVAEGTMTGRYRERRSGRK